METNVKDGPAQRDDELFDVVNANDEPVGRATRREVHARGLWHRAVHALVFDRAGRVFLQKRSWRKDMAPGCWDSSCSGHLDAGENYDAAILRELAEEIGVIAPAENRPARWFRLTACAETGWEFVWVYRFFHDGPFVLHPAEIETGAWMTSAEVTGLLATTPDVVAPAFRWLWPQAVARLE